MRVRMTQIQENIRESAKARLSGWRSLTMPLSPGFLPYMNIKGYLNLFVKLTLIKPTAQIGLGVMGRF